MESTTYEIKEYIAKNKGITVYNGRIINKRMGYFIGIKSLGTTNNIDKCIEIIRKIKNNYVGIWLNPDTGLYEIDISFYETIKEYAIIRAKKHSQLAIWDIKNKSNIWISEV